MASTASGIEYPTAGDFIAPLNAHLQTLAETTQDALDERAPEESTTYTPTFTGLTLGNGTVSARYSKVGNIIVDEIVVTFGSTTAITGPVFITGMQPAVANVPTMITGYVMLHDNGSTYFPGSARQSSTTAVEVHAQLANGTYVSLGSLSSTIPHTWAVNDQIIVKTVRLAA
jgi:hypothetical protein